MRLLPSGSSAVLVEVEDLEAVLALYAALQADPPSGVLDMVPAARTVLLIIDLAITSLREVADAVRSRSHQERKPSGAELIELPVTYDGADLDEVARKLGCDAAEVVRRHTEQEWTVAFCGFAPGFGYLVSEAGSWDVARRSSPRTKVPAGAVGLAGEFTGVYPRESPGGWQIIGRTDVSVFDLSRDPPPELSTLRSSTFILEEPDSRAGSEQGGRVRSRPCRMAVAPVRRPWGSAGRELPIAAPMGWRTGWWATILGQQSSR